MGRPLVRAAACSDNSAILMPPDLKASLLVSGDWDHLGNAGLLFVKTTHFSPKGPLVPSAASAQQGLLFISPTLHLEKRHDTWLTEETTVRR